MIVRLAVVQIRASEKRKNKESFPMTERLRDLNQALHVRTRIGVGSHRSRLPRYVSFMPPCNHACPAGENIQGWLAHAEKGAFEAAWRLLVQENALPAIHGRACYHPCEGQCNRAGLDEPIAIHEVERFLGDLARENGWKVSCGAATGRRVLVVGSGPAGIACAYHLALLGHAVEIREAAPRPGGMMAYGIPAYRLPMAVLDDEIARVLAMPGVTLRCNSRVDDLSRLMDEGKFDAAFVAVGASRALTMTLPVAQGRQAVEAIDLLHAVREGKRPVLGRVVAVIGGGNVAMDAARTARRLGAQEVIMIYRRDRDHMPAHTEEREAAEAEGVTIRYCSIVRRFSAQGVEIEAVSLDRDNGLTPTGEIDCIPADTVILAIGQHADLSLCAGFTDIVIDRGDVLGVDETFMTGHRGVFAGGDCVPGTRTMTTATGHGKHAARAIDAYLSGLCLPVRHKPEIVTFDMMHMPLLVMAGRAKPPELPAAQRAGFEEIVAGLVEKSARREAGRCLSCGNCYECDNCFAACSEQAITRLGPGRGYVISAALCTGCGDCVEQCPCTALAMRPEPVGAVPDDGAIGEPLSPAKFMVRA
ncbi:glutamate synthase [Asaia sp. W19]|uniref:NAD(P)-binding protein n=1 Tax=unclassified Asaia TaxID=2685023 RepID=UPI000F8C6E10|nr:NAD(P)-binding protein [Asaia sp. W19]RUT26381.1 glutamate synthase [Asaia sp. W19]